MTGDIRSRARGTGAERGHPDGQNQQHHHRPCTRRPPTRTRDDLIDEDISVRACLRSVGRLAGWGALAVVVLGLLSWRAGDAPAVWQVVVVFCVVSLGPIMWLRSLTPSPRQRRRYLAAVALAALWGSAWLALLVVAGIVTAGD
jgi:hypothetical protein